MQRRSPFDMTRRRLIQGLGLGVAGSSLIPLLNADAQTAVRPKRLLLIFTPDGAPVGIDWKPTGTETAFNFHFIQAPLQPFAAKTVVPWGLSLTAKGAGEQHAFGMAGLWTATTLPGPGSGASFDGGNGNLTGWGAAPSIDQIIAQASGPNMPYQRPPNDTTNPPETRYRSLALGVQCQGPNTLNRMTYTAANSPITPEVNPRAAFDRILAGVMPGTTMPPPAGMPVGENPTVTRNRIEQKALVDCIRGDLTKIRTRVGAADYQKIDKHLEGLLAMERRLGTGPATSTPIAACAPGTQPATNLTFPQQITSMMDIVAGVLSCDVTRVMTLQLSYAFSHVLHTWLGHTSDHHNMSHDGQDRKVQLQAIDNWYAKQVAYLLTAMDSVNEGNGTLLDNTLIVWGRELGNTSHSLARSPLLLIGKAGGALRSGRFLNYDGQQHVKLLVSVCQLMGLPTTSLGNIVPNSGPLVGLV